MDAATTIVFWWLMFGGSHTLMSHPPVRAALVGALGAQRFMLAYSALSFATFVPLIVCYVRLRTPHAVPLPSLLHHPSVHWLSLVLMALALFLIVLAYVRISPVAFTRNGHSAQGALRITRHPLFMGLGLMGLAHLLVNPLPVDRAFFGGLFLYSVLGCLHQDWRKRKIADEHLQKFFAETSLWPFVAIAQGRNRLVLSEIRPLAWALVVGLYVALFLFHHQLFGA